jgi:hypothetical protein
VCLFVVCKNYLHIVHLIIHIAFHFYTLHSICTITFSQPHFEANVRMRLALPKSGNLESSRTPKNSELDCRGQNTSLGGVHYIIEKVSKCRCRKWPRMCDSDIYSTSYGRKKGQFDSRPLKVGNRPDPGVCRWSATHRWKALEETYKFALDLIPIGGLRWELWAFKVPRVQTGTVSGLPLGSPETKNHLNTGAVKRHKEYYMGEGGGFPRIRAVLTQVSPCCPWLVLAPRCSRMWTNHFVVGLMQVQVSE